MDAKLHDELGRLAALNRYEVLDTPKEPAFDRITALVQKVLDVPICAVSLIDAQRQWLKACVGVGGLELPREIAFCSHTIQQREPFLVTDALTDERFRDNPLVVGDPHIRSYVGVPLSTPDGYNVGSLCAADTKIRVFTADQVVMLQSFAALVVDELELRRIAHTDHLTEAATRRSFLLEMEKAIAQYRRNGTSSALIVLDVDHFKRVNDTYGHPTGDNVLCTVASVLQGELRVNDLLGRLGGEEFGIVLRGATLPEAFQSAERLRAALVSAEIAHETPFRVTASFGVAVLDDGTSPEDWLAEADQALYEAKRGGRNRCCVATRTEAAVA